MPVDTGLVAAQERIRVKSVEQLLGVYEDALDMLGPIPLGFTKGSPEDILEQFLTIAATPGGLNGIVMQNAAAVGLDAAEAQVANFVTRMYRALCRRGMGRTVTIAEINQMPDAEVQRAILAGAETVWSVQLAKRLRNTERTLARLDALDAKPKARLFEVPRRPQLDQLLGMGGAVV
jgi:hypothetical protein